MVHASTRNAMPKLGTVGILLMKGGSGMLVQLVIYLSLVSNLTSISMNPPWVMLDC